MHDKVVISSAVRHTGRPPSCSDVSLRDGKIMASTGLSLLHGLRLASSRAHIEAVPGSRRAAFAALDMVDPEIEDLAPAVLNSTVNGKLEQKAFYERGWREIHPLWPLAMLNNVVFSLACSYAEIEGDNAVFSPGPETFLNAIAEAAGAISSGRADAAFATAVSPSSELCLYRSKLCVPPHRAPTEDSDRMSGCGGTLILESEEHARRRGRRPSASVAGWAFAQQGRDGSGFRGVMNTVSRRAGIPMHDLDLIVLAGEPGYDQGEIESIEELIGSAEGPTLCSADSVASATPPGNIALVITELVERIRSNPRSRILVNVKGVAGQLACLVLGGVE